MQIANKTPKRLIVRGKNFCAEIFGGAKPPRSRTFDRISNRWMKNSAQVPATK
jgi:hypothetical protein